MNKFPSIRLRRLRQSAALRSLTGTTFPPPSRFVWPIFLIEGQNSVEPIPSLPGQSYYTVDCIIPAVEEVLGLGVNSFLLFSMVSKEEKKNSGSYAHSENGLVQRALKVLRKEFPEISLFADTGLSGYTDHGHAGIINTNGVVDNDLTLEALGRIALSQAAAGATCVAPSGMIDGQVGFIRSLLDESGFEDVLIMSYAVKFHSHLYGAFPYAVETPRENDPRTQTYLAPPSDTRQATREALLDQEEGADIIMVKPAQFYLDIINNIRSSVLLPIAGYNVSGEYAMLHAAAKAGYHDLYTLAHESLLSIHRAGADIIISYWANQLDKISLKGEIQ